MAEKTQKQLLTNLISMQQVQNKDIAEIKTCLLGNEYHSEGLVYQVGTNTESIININNTQAKRNGIVITLSTVFAAIVATIVTTLVSLVERN